MSVLQIPIVKANGRVMEFDTKELSDGILLAAIEIGLKELANARMSKIKTKDLEGAALAEAQDAAWEAAEKNKQSLLDGKLTKTKRGAKAAADGVPKGVMAEAMRLARKIVKDTIKDNKMRIGDFTASEITALAKEVLENDQSLLEVAAENLAKRIAPKVALKLQPNPELVAKNNAKAATEKAARKGTLSATQAGKPRVAPARGAKPGRESHAAH